MRTAMRGAKILGLSYYDAAQDQDATLYLWTADALRVVPAPSVCGTRNLPSLTVAGSSKHSLTNERVRARGRRYEPKRDAGVLASYRQCAQRQAGDGPVPDPQPATNAQRLKNTGQGSQITNEEKAARRSEWSSKVPQSGTKCCAKKYILG